MTHYEIVMKLIGEVKPVGDSRIDAERFENLKELALLIDALIADMDDVALNAGRQEYSANKAGEYAQKFLEQTLTK